MDKQKLYKENGYVYPFSTEEVDYDTRYIVVAAADSDHKELADVVCTGIHDEVKLQQALDMAIDKRCKGISLKAGEYHIDGFTSATDGGPDYAMCIKGATSSQSFDIEIKGVGGLRGGSKSVISVSADALDSITRDTDVIRSVWTSVGLGNTHHVRIYGFCFNIANNLHPLRVIDLRRCDRANVENILMVVRGDMVNTVPVEGLIGITMTDGSNFPGCNYKDININGFYEAFQCGGEHVIMENCFAQHGVYGYTFGNYPYNNSFVHPITLINCASERMQHIAHFGTCGAVGGIHNGNQTVSMIDFTIEWFEPSATTGHVNTTPITEDEPGRFGGTITYTIMDSITAHGKNAVDKPLFDIGCGIGFHTTNTAHRKGGTTALRLTYAPNYMQQYYDTDLDKLLTCIDPDNKTWVDTDGNNVDV